ncbi:MAG: flagellar assembly protein FliW [Candidatus Eisenbacteria sp.]|nr:flagellar assembly protein FliW [Candidatus Eisenbacteria bacterium]
MRIRTPLWGTLEVADDQLVHLPEGLVGFEDFHRFVLVDVAEYHPFLWLLSTENPSVGFAVAEPRYFREGTYPVTLSATDESHLELAAGDTLAIFVIIAIDAEQCVTANLRGPIVLNTRNRIAKQIIAFGTSLSLREPIRPGLAAPPVSAVEPAVSGA